MLDLIRARPRFYRRPWFLATLTLLFILLFAGGIWGLVEKGRWETMAKAFDYSRLDDMESASIIYDRGGNVLGRIFIQNRDQVPITEISANLITAVVAAEDARYYKHHGWDFIGIVRAAVTNFRSKKSKQGASTITQQLARNTFPAQLPPNDRTYQRKLLEIFVAREIEDRLGSKQKILELYLNRVFFGSGFYGAEAAARGYFGKRAKDLNLSEAATLAGLLKSPSNLSPWRDRKACIDSRNYVLQRARELDFITREEYERTVREDLAVKNRRPTHQESYAADLVATQVEKLVGRDAAVSDGYRIFTTIDTGLQKKAEQALREQLASVERHELFEGQKFSDYDAKWKAWAKKPPGPDGEIDTIAPPEYLQGSIVVLDNTNGGILAVVGGRDFSHSEFNRALLARRPSGTAFKPIVYAAAFESGLFPGSLVKDEVMDNRQVMIGGLTGILGEWGPERMDNKYEGNISAREALVKSKNAASVRLGMMVGKDLKDSLARLGTLAKAAGIDSPLRQYPSSFLGSSEVTLLEMTGANTMFATGGVRPKKPWIIASIQDPDGQTIYKAKPEQVRVLRPAAAFEVHSCLADVLERGTADSAFTELGLKKFALGGKTGTAYNFTDLWFLGYSSAVTCGVWIGFDKPRTIYRGAFSHDIALPVWAEVMRASFVDHHPGEIARPAGLKSIEICSSSGLRATPKCSDTLVNAETGESVQRRTTYFELATEEQTPKDLCDIHGGGVRSNVRSVAAGEWPRATAVVDLTTRAPVAMQGPTVVGDLDPYNSTLALNNAVALKALSGQLAPMDNTGQVPAPGEAAGPEVRRAEPVRGAEATGPEVPIKLAPPKAIDF
ncbi:MAG: transglycosylase domain-containing protein [Chthoniobacteraceae bacterium]